MANDSAALAGVIGYAWPPTGALLLPISCDDVLAAAGLVNIDDEEKELAFIRLKFDVCPCVFMNELRLLAGEPACPFLEFIIMGVPCFGDVAMPIGFGEGEGETIMKRLFWY